jgi:hypothetical protein
MNAAIQPLYLALGKFTPPVQPTSIAEVQRKAIDAKQAEIDAAYSQLNALETLLEECRKHLEGQIDVVDGSHGQPAPNLAMQLVCQIDDILDGGL